MSGAGRSWYKSSISLTLNERPWHCDSKSNENHEIYNFKRHRASDLPLRSPRTDMCCNLILTWAGCLHQYNYGVVLCVRASLNENRVCDQLEAPHHDSIWRFSCTICRYNGPDPRTVQEATHEVEWLKWRFSPYSTDAPR